MFDDLPEAGKPLPGIDEPYDSMWWVKRKLGDELKKRYDGCG